MVSTAIYVVKVYECHPLDNMSFELKLSKIRFDQFEMQLWNKVFRWFYIMHWFQIWKVNHFRRHVLWNNLIYYWLMCFLNVYSNSWASAANDMSLTTKHDNRELDPWLVRITRVLVGLIGRVFCSHVLVARLVGITQALSLCLRRDGAWTLHLHVHKKKNHQ